MVLDVIFNKFLPTTMAFLSFTILWAMGEKDGALLVLGTGFTLQVLWLWFRYGNRR